QVTVLGVALHLLPALGRPTTLLATHRPLPHINPQETCRPWCQPPLLRGVRSGPGAGTAVGRGRGARLLQVFLKCHASVLLQGLCKGSRPTPGSAVRTVMHAAYQSGRK